MLNPNLQTVPPPRGHLRMELAQEIPRLLRELGTEPDAVLAHFQLSESSLNDPEASIRVDMMARILAACAQAVSRPHFGLMLGLRNSVSTLGQVGFHLSHAPDVGTALKDLVANLTLVNPLVVPSLETNLKLVSLSYSTFGEGVEGAAEFHDAALAMSFGVVRALCGPDWLPTEVRLRRLRPLDIQPYRQTFQAPVIFDAERSGLSFPARWLSRATQHADPSLYHYFSRQVEMLHGYGRNDFAVLARHALFRMHGVSCYTRKDLADKLLLHPRTLNRRLKEAGTSFRELLNSVRHELACHHLHSTQSNIESIASLLGYSGANAFCRAFSQWEGVPPAIWRKRIQDRYKQDGRTPRHPGRSNAPGLA